MTAADDSDLSSQDEICQQLRREGRVALAAYFDQVRERLRRVVGFRLNPRLRGRVSESDVLQETFVRAEQRLDKYLQQPDVPFFVWLRAEAAQRVIEIHRFHLVADKRDVRREVRLSPGPQTHVTSMALAAHLIGAVTSPSLAFERQQQIEALETSLNEMNETDREVIALRNFEELSNLETAQVLGITPDTASKRYLRALKRLKEIMQQHHLVP